MYGNGTGTFDDRQARVESKWTDYSIHILTSGNCEYFHYSPHYHLHVMMIHIDAE